jgi:hypothetical protein
MNRDALLTHLARTEENIAEGERRIARQRQVIAQLQAEQRDTTGDPLLLELLQDLQSAYLTVRRRIRDELEKQGDLEKRFDADSRDM